MNKSGIGRLAGWAIGLWGLLLLVWVYAEPRFPRPAAGDGCWAGAAIELRFLPEPQSADAWDTDRLTSCFEEEGVEEPEFVSVEDQDDAPDLMFNSGPCYFDPAAPYRSPFTARPFRDDETGRAIQRALRWMADHQERSGLWRPGSCPDCALTAGAETAAGEADPLGTAFALLAFSQTGNGAAVGPFQEPVMRSMLREYRSQKASGSFSGKCDPEDALTRHAVLLLFFNDLHRLTSVPFARLCFLKGLAWPGVDRASAEGDGWEEERFEARSSTGRWLKMLELDLAAEDRLGEWKRAGFAAFWRRTAASEAIPDDPVTALMDRLFLGPGQSRPSFQDLPDVERVRLQMRELAAVPLAWGELRSLEDLEDLYFRALLLARWGGRLHAEWRSAMEELLLARQVRDGHSEGSWPPVGGDPAGFGRLRATALCVLILDADSR